MKKSLLALAALTAFAGAASAQSSVTLFGIVDLAATSIKNGSAGETKSLAQDGINSSRLGFRGVEDLGGGLRAGFWLEGALGADTGCGGSGTLGSPTAVPAVSTTVNQSTGAPITTGVSVTPASDVCIGQNWQRRSTVSLLGAFGEIRLGRDYTSTFWNLTIFDPFGTNGTGSALNNNSTLGSGAGTAVRANNMIAYFLPALGGFYGQVQVAAGEGWTGTGAGSTGNKYVGGRFGYGAGPVNVAVAYGKTYKTGTMVDDFTNVNVGASYNFGFMTLEGYFGKYDYSVQSQKQALLGLLVPIGAGTIKASYIKSSGGTTDQFASTQYAFGYQYDLSKRTALYAQYASLNNDGSAATGAKFAIYGANGSKAFVNGGETSSGYQFGIRHSF
jgi:predicted porin